MELEKSIRDLGEKTGIELLNVQKLQEEIVLNLAEISVVGDNDIITISNGREETILDHIIRYNSLIDGMKITKLNMQPFVEFENAARSVGGKSFVEREKSIKKLARCFAIALSLIPAIMISAGIGSMIDGKIEGGVVTRSGAYAAEIVATNVITKEVTTEIVSRFSDEVGERLNAVLRSNDRARRRPNIMIMDAVISGASEFMCGESIPCSIEIGIGAAIGAKVGFDIMTQTMKRIEGTIEDTIKKFIFGTKVNSLFPINATVEQIDTNQVDIAH